MKISIHNYIYLPLLLILILKFNIANCQILTNSNLPIVIINTGGVTIPDEPKIPASFKIINNVIYFHLYPITQKYNILTLENLESLV